MNNILIVYATRYGSTETIAGWIAERVALDGHTTKAIRAEETPTPETSDMVVIGSGIYGHRFLQSIDEYIKQYQILLQSKKTALFGVAMRTETFFKGGKAYGGTVMLEKYGEMLGKGCMMGKILGGEMIFDKLNDKDKSGLEKFYASIGLTGEAINARKAPRTLLSKKDCWDYAEGLLKLL